MGERLKFWLALIVSSVAILSSTAARAQTTA